MGQSGDGVGEGGAWVGAESSPPPVLSQEGRRTAGLYLAQPYV